MRLHRLVCFIVGLAVGLLLLAAPAFFRPHEQTVSIIPQLDAIIDSPPPSLYPPPPPLADLSDDEIGALLTPTGNPTKIKCAAYAGPLRWRRNPGGRGAPSMMLHTLPVGEPQARLSPPRRALLAFASADLRLADDGGPFAQAAATNANFLRLLPQERLFWSFRQTAGLRQPRGARPFGGWERPGAGIRGHFVGHYLTALAIGGSGGDGTLVALAIDALAVLSACARAHASNRLPGYLAAFPPSEFDKVEALGHGPHGDAWVPHYASEKVMSGLLAIHHELGLPGALPLALGMAEYVWLRSRRVHASKGEAHWSELLNYEVGAMSQVFVQAASASGNASWLDAASLFDRRCFTGSMALAGALHDDEDPNGGRDPHGNRGGSSGGPARASHAAEGAYAPFGQSAAEAAAAVAGMSGMHANAQLAYVLGATSRYEATGEANARLAAEAYFRTIQSTYTYLSGGSSFMEEWKGPGALAESLTHRGRKNWAAHDHQESCVTHHSMIISRRLLSWGARACKVRASKGGKGGKDSGSGGREWRSELHAHADWLDRALYNGVLGTQRGTQGARPSERVFEHSLQLAHRRRRSADIRRRPDLRLLAYCVRSGRDGLHDAIGRRRLQGGRQPRLLEWREPLLVLHGVRHRGLYANAFVRLLPPKAQRTRRGIARQG